MRNILKLKMLQMPFSSKKIGIAETVKNIQDKIMSISQVVRLLLFRMMLNSLVLSSALVMVLPELLASIKFKLVKWSNSDQEFEEWPSTYKLIMLVLSSLVTIGKIKYYSEKFKKEIL
jgi:hypothetical protein